MPHPPAGACSSCKISFVERPQDDDPSSKLALQRSLGGSWRLTSVGHVLCAPAIRRRGAVSRFALASVALVASSFLLLAFALSYRHVNSSAGRAGVALALYAGGLTVVRSFYVLSRVVVMRAAGAEPAARSQRPDLHRLLDEVCVRAGLATPPRFYLLEDSALNSFASGSSPESSVIVMTTGLVESLPRYELRAVIAHEVTHIIADDVLIPALS